MYDSTKAPSLDIKRKVVTSIQRIVHVDFKASHTPVNHNIEIVWLSHPEIFSRETVYSLLPIIV